jgi:hypothetical protein
LNLPFLFAVEELYGTRYQSGSFSLTNVGSVFHCLRSFFFFHLPKNWKGRKGTICDIAALIKISNLSSMHLPGPTDRYKLKRGNCLSFGHIKDMDCQIEDIKNEGGNS